MKDKNEIKYKFQEDHWLTVIKEHIDKTYDSHYSKTKFQASEFIIDSGHGTGFCMGNILKYAQRYGKKGSREDHKKDLLKILHYAIIQMHVNEKEAVDSYVEQVRKPDLETVGELRTLGAWGEDC